MGFLHHWSCLGKGFVNVGNVDDTSRSVGSVVWVGGRGMGGRGGGGEGYLDTVTLHVCCSTVCPFH